MLQRLRLLRVRQRQLPLPPGGKLCTRHDGLSTRAAGARSNPGLCGANSRADNDYPPTSDDICASVDHDSAPANDGHSNHHGLASHDVGANYSAAIHNGRPVYADNLRLPGGFDALQHRLLPQLVPMSAEAGRGPVVCQRDHIRPRMFRDRGWAVQRWLRVHRGKMPGVLWVIKPAQ